MIPRSAFARQALELRLVERAVVELADVADQGRRGRWSCRLVVAVELERRLRGAAASGAHQWPAPPRVREDRERLIAGFTKRRRRAREARPSQIDQVRRSVRELDRNLQLAGDDSRLDLVHRGDVLLRHGRVDLADANAVVLQREDQVLVAPELLQSWLP